jgi:hypothetical protein
MVGGSCKWSPARRSFPAQGTAIQQAISRACEHSSITVMLKIIRDRYYTHFGTSKYFLFFSVGDPNLHVFGSLLYLFLSIIYILKKEENKSLIKYPLQHMLETQEESW